MLLFGFPCGPAGKVSTYNVGDLSSILGLGRSPGEEKVCLFQYSGLENSIDFIVHRVAESDISEQLSLYTSPFFSSPVSLPMDFTS